MATAGTQQTAQMQALIDGLNQDLAGEYQAMISYVQYSAVVSGPYRPQLVQFFLAEVADEQRHAEYLANKIAALGGDPTVTPKEVPTSRDTREMLSLIQRAEAETIENYRQRIDQAEAAGEIGLKVQLEEFVSDETNHKEEVEKILANWQ
jgi:bacterioferritin